ncbi:hypothetical protein EXS70_01360 [Candidatus Peribacteria bacterium]|nr:hypothetical protein [Candidatus Peribacteria bacterium]
MNQENQVLTQEQLSKEVLSTKEGADARTETTNYTTPPKISDADALRQEVERAAMQLIAERPELLDKVAARHEILSLMINGFSGVDGIMTPQRVKLVRTELGRLLKLQKGKGVVKTKTAARRGYEEVEGCTT